MTEQQLLLKLTTICARGEHCKEDLRRKMRRWEIDEEMQEKALVYLEREHYVDEARYARFFINDKIQFNKWGKRKVEQALYMKRIPREVYSPILDEYEDDAFKDTLLPLLRQKKRSVKAKSNYECRMKLIRYALQRGFSYEQAEQCMRNLDIED